MAAGPNCKAAPYGPERFVSRRGPIRYPDEGPKKVNQHLPIQLVGAELLESTTRLRSRSPFFYSHDTSNNVGERRQTHVATVWNAPPCHDVDAIAKPCRERLDQAGLPDAGRTKDGKHCRAPVYYRSLGGVPQSDQITLAPNQRGREPWSGACVGNISKSISHEGSLVVVNHKKLRRINRSDSTGESQSGYAEQHLTGTSLSGQEIGNFNRIMRQKPNVAAYLN